MSEPTMNQIPDETREEISDDISNLLERTREGIQQEINRAALFPPVAELVLLVLDGTSPLATLAPPDIRAGGANKVAATVLRRADLVRSLNVVYPILAAALDSPSKCGHLEYLATTVRGGVLLCTDCDLGLKAKTAKA